MLENLLLSIQRTFLSNKTVLHIQYIQCQTHTLINLNFICLYITKCIHRYIKKFIKSDQNGLNIHVTQINYNVEPCGQTVCFSGKCFFVDPMTEEGDPTMGEVVPPSDPTLRVRIFTGSGCLSMSCLIS